MQYRSTFITKIFQPTIIFPIHQSSTHTSKDSNIHEYWTYIIIFPSPKKIVGRIEMEKITPLQLCIKELYLKPLIKLRCELSSRRFEICQMLANCFWVRMINSSQEISCYLKTATSFEGWIQKHYNHFSNSQSACKKKRVQLQEKSHLSSFYWWNMCSIWTQMVLNVIWKWIKSHWVYIMFTNHILWPKKAKISSY